MRRPGCRGATLVLTCALVLSVSAVAAAVPGTVRHSTMPVLPSWSHPHPNVSYASIACHSIGSCTVVGVHTDSTAAYHPATDTEHGNVWAPPKTIALPDGAVAISVALGFRSIACPTQSSCVAVGTYWDPSPGRGFEPMLASQTNGVWGTATTAVPLPAGATMAELDAIWCGSVGNCVATGSFWKSVSGDSRAFVDKEVGGSWQPSITLPVPSSGLPHPVGISPSSISCAKLNECVVVGEISSSASPGTQLGIAEVERGGRWRAHLFFFSKTAGTVIVLTSVACPTTTLCIAAGSGGTTAAKAAPLAEAYVDGRWRTGKILPYKYFAPATSGGQLEGVSCPSPTRCVAVGELISTGVSMTAAPLNAGIAGQLPVAYTWQRGRWTQPALVGAPATGAPSAGAVLAGIACPTTRECEVVGTTTPLSATKAGAYPYSAVVVPASTGSPPSAPKGIEVASGSGAFNVTWHGPSSYGGSPIQSFFVIAHSAHEPTVSCVTISLSCTLSGIAQSHRYTLYITARNAALRLGPSARATATG